MNGSRAFMLASVPAAAGVAWQQYRRAVRDVESHPVLAPTLPGRRRELSTDWGSVAYRWVEGDPHRPTLVLVHGWGKTADSAWWPVIKDCDRTMVVVDLPGHGLSRLDERFTFPLAAEAVERAVVDAGVIQPVLVGHSMGGPVAFETIRRVGPGGFSGLLALATSAYWVRPRLRMMMMMAPLLMAPRSPILIQRERRELREVPDIADHVAWAYTERPRRKLLNDTADALRGFDARRWNDLSLPPTTWVVATQDGVLAPEHQRASARHFGASVIEIATVHSMVLYAPETVLEVLTATGWATPGRRPSTPDSPPLNHG